MDTTIHNVIVDTLQLHTLNTKLSQLQDSILKKNYSPEISIWVPVIAAIIGGSLVWIGQFFERHTKRKVETKNRLEEIYAYCQKLEAIMRNNYRELAMAKNHVEYWWYCYNSDRSAPRDYEEHLKSQSYAREIERRIGDTKAEYIGHVYKFQIIRPIQMDIQKELNIIADLTNARANIFEKSLAYDTVRYELTDLYEKELRERYFQNLEPFKKINALLAEAIISFK